MKKDITYLIYKINSYFRLTTTNTSKTDNSKLYTNNKGEHFRFIPFYSAPDPPEEEEEDLFSPVRVRRGLNGFSKGQTTPPSGKESKGLKIVKIIESKISKVLVGKMPSNKHIVKARETLIYMLNVLPVDNIIYPFIMEYIYTDYIFNADVSNGKLIPKQIFSWSSIYPYTLPVYEGGTYLFHLILTGHEYLGSAAYHSYRADQNISHFKGDSPKALHIRRCGWREK